MKTKLTLIPVLVIATLALTTSNANARENKLVRAAHAIEDIALELRDEFRFHYSHSSAYRHLRNDVSQIIREIEHIDGMAHNPHSSLCRIKADLADLDDLAHHLHDLVDAVEDGRYRGHVDGNTRHVHTLLASLNDSIHCMERIVASYAAPPIRHDNHRHHAHRNEGARVVGAVIGAIIESRRHRHHCR